MILAGGSTVVIKDLKKNKVIVYENKEKVSYTCISLHPGQNYFCLGDSQGNISFFDFRKQILYHLKR